jgi:hypothetical protein
MWLRIGGVSQPLPPYTVIAWHKETFCRLRLYNYFYNNCRPTTSFRTFIWQNSSKNFRLCTRTGPYGNIRHLCFNLLYFPYNYSVTTKISCVCQYMQWSTTPPGHCCCSRIIHSDLNRGMDVRMRPHFLHLCRSLWHLSLTFTVSEFKTSQRHTFLEGEGNEDLYRVPMQCVTPVRHT